MKIREHFFHKLLQNNRKLQRVHLFVSFLFGCICCIVQIQHCPLSLQFPPWWYGHLFQHKSRQFRLYLMRLEFPSLWKSLYLLVFFLYNKSGSSNDFTVMCEKLFEIHNNRQWPYSQTTTKSQSFNCIRLIDLFVWSWKRVFTTTLAAVQGFTAGHNSMATLSQRCW